MTANDFLISFRAGNAVTVGVIGDSTSMGYGANPGPILHGNNIAYAYDNYPAAGPNWMAGNQYEIKTLASPSGRLHPDTQANTGIPSGIRLLETWLKSFNPGSIVYNYSGSGWSADNHISNGSITALAAQTPKPDVVLIPIGINSAKNHASQKFAVQTLINQCISAAMIPVLVKENNIAMDIVTGTWFGPGFGNNYSPPENWVIWSDWLSYRSAIDTLAATNGLEVIDLGTANGAIDITKLYDPFHPNAAGYQDIFSAYSSWFGSQADQLKPARVMVRAADGYRPARIYSLGENGFFLSSIKIAS